MPVERTDVDVEAFLALARARSAPRTVEAYGRDLAHFAAWLDRPCAEATTEEIEDRGHQELLNWFCLAGAMAELDRKPDYAVFLESWITNSDKVFAAFRP